MVLPIKYESSQSSGTAFETGTTKTVAVTAEGLDEVDGYEGDAVVYTATVKDDGDGALPAAFVADLEINGTQVVTAQAFDAGCYDQSTKLLTLPWTVPPAVAAFTVKLIWAEQLI